MAREIKGRIFRIQYTATWSYFVECTDITQLFEYVADEMIGGRIVTGVTEILTSGGTPKVKVLSDKEFKKILKEKQNKNTISEGTTVYCVGRGYFLDNNYRMSFYNEFVVKRMEYEKFMAASVGETVFRTYTEAQKKADRLNVFQGVEK